MSSRSFPLLFLLLLPVISSCNSEVRRIRQTLAAFEKTAIVLPQDMLYVKDGERGFGYQETPGPKLVYYVDSSECTSCAISHLNVFDPVFDWADSLQTFSVIIILSPKEEDQHKALLDLEMFPFKEIVYVDVNGSFMHSNPSIPSESRYHCFLIDENGYPFFVGNPLAGDKIRSVFFESLDKYIVGSGRS
jgi:hypothetical protein